MLLIEVYFTANSMTHDLNAQENGDTAEVFKGILETNVTGILTTLVLAKVLLRLSRFNYERIEVLYTP